MTSNYLTLLRIPQDPSGVQRGLDDTPRSVGATIPESLPSKDTDRTASAEPTLARTSWSAKATVLTFETINDMLKDYEGRFGFSSIDMFKRYAKGELDDDPVMDEWVNTFLLYLGTSNIRKYSCP